MRYQPALVALGVAAAAGACQPRRAETPCPPGDNMPVVRPDTTRYRMPSAVPDELHDSAMAVKPPCPDTAG